MAMGWKTGEAWRAGLSEYLRFEGELGPLLPTAPLRLFYLQPPPSQLSSFVLNTYLHFLDEKTENKTDRLRSRRVFIYPFKEHGILTLCLSLF